MPTIQWDRIGDRVYQMGVSKGVLYLPNGRAIPWNGLTSVTEKPSRNVSEVYYDGVKINDLPTISEFKATVTALTYPEEFSDLESGGDLRPGFYMGDRPPQVFGISYVTNIGSDLDPNAGYLIHVVYNVTATPSDRTFNSLSDDPEVVEFQWDISAIPEDIEGFRPTSKVVIDSRKVDPWLLQEIEERLYGSLDSDPTIPPLQELYNLLLDWYRFLIEDNFDGTATITASRPEGIVELPTGGATLIGINHIDHGDGVIELFTTYDLNISGRLNIMVNSDGTWVASTDAPNIIEVDPITQEFVIHAPVAVFLNEDTYVLEDSWVPEETEIPE